MGEGGSELERLRTTARNNPQQARDWYALGIASLQAGLLDEARESLLNAGARGPGDVQLCLSIAQILIANSRSVDAATVLEGSIRVAPRVVETRLLLARALSEAREIERALEALDGLGAQRISAIANVASSLEVDGHAAQSLMLCEAALRMSPDALDLLRICGRGYGRFGEIDRCLAAWAEVVRRTEGRDLEALMAWGIASSNAGRHVDAVDALYRVAQAQPKSAEAYANLGMALLTAGRASEGTSALLNAVRLNPRSAQAHTALGAAFQQQGRMMEAINELTLATELQPDWLVPHFNLALAMEANGDPAGARRALLRASALAPDDPEILAALDRLIAPHVAQTSSHTKSGVEQLKFSIQGDLKTFGLLDLLEFLRVQSKTGTLQLTSRSGAGLIRMRQGRLTSAWAPSIKRLGELLVSANALSQEALDQFLAREHERDEAQPELLGALLLKHQLVSKNQLAQAMGQQVHAAFHELLQWKDGEFAFHPWDTTDLPISTIDFDLQQTTLDILREIDESTATLH